jgi:NADH-quinone oxidoreductase subunit M
VALLSAWHEINHRCGLFYLNFLFTLAGVVGVFSALDLFLFFVFWEVMLVPMFLIIAIWGHEGRRYAATKFFIYTQASSLLMLAAMVGLVLLNQQQTGVWSFSWFTLTQTDTSGSLGMWLMLGFYVAFLVKLPGLPVHNWLPDAHTQAPTPGSILLAGILLKTGAYGLLRFVWPLFPDAASSFAPIAMGLGVLSVLYAAKLAFAQNDLKRLIAYTSISHMGFVSLGIFAWNHLSLQGTVMQMVGHGLSSAGLFAIAGLLQQRLHTRDLDKMGGLWGQMPKLAALSMLFAVAALGLPGLANFIGEFMVLLGVFQVAPWAASLAALGMILAPVYALIIMQKGFFGASLGTQAAGTSNVLDLNTRELLMLAVLVVGLVLLGFWPNLIFTITAAPVDYLMHLGKGG